MPRLLSFTPCESGAVDGFTGKISLWFVMETVRPIGAVQAPEGEIPTVEGGEVHYFVPPFMIVSHWWREDGEEGHEFEQMIVIRAPDGRETLLPPLIRFTPTGPFHRVFHQIQFVTFRMAGRYELVLRLRPVDREAWDDISSYPLIIEEPASDQPTSGLPG